MVEHYLYIIDHEIMNSLENSLRSLSLDYLNLLINGQAFSDVTFSVEGRLVHAHRCILATQSLFFRKFFCGSDPHPSADVMVKKKRGIMRTLTRHGQVAQVGLALTTVGSPIHQEPCGCVAMIPRMLFPN
ncbi:hypothetical protein G4B88_030723 [Cannabis sativa]|uniref:BTB domain-containing protein n=1 Tax=Cannabis sativa TaxID=3483 RepID=A0A7J6H8G3_CANSA|nr:hypothetical protein G4B88_030723 [Cannabis sativa]